MRPRLVLALFVGLVVAGTSGLAIWRMRVLVGRDLGVLTGQIDSLSAEWDGKKIPVAERMVTIVLSDIRAADDPFLDARESTEGLIETASGWIRRNLIGADPSVQTPTALGRAFQDSTTLVKWTHDGFSSVTEEAMSRELEVAFVKAHEAGAEINIVAQGQAAAPVLAALKRLEGVERGGAKVGANKVVLLGVRNLRLKTIPGIGAYSFGKMGNVIELASIWVPRETFVNRVTMMQLSTGGGEGAEFDIEAVWPGLGSGPDAIQKLLRVIRESVESPKSIEELLRQASLPQEQGVPAEASRETGNSPVVLKGHSAGVTSLAFSADGSEIFSGGGQDEPLIIVWDADSGERRKEWRAHPPARISVAGRQLDIGGVAALSAPAGAPLISVGGSGEATAWDGTSHKELRTWKLTTAGTGGVDFSQTGGNLLCADLSGRIGYWSVASGKRLAYWNGHSDAAIYARLSRDGAWAISFGGDSDGELRVKAWEAATGRLVGEIKIDADWLAIGSERVLISHGGKMAVLARPDLRRLVEWTLPRGKATSFELSPDEKFIAVGYEDGSIQLMDGNSGNLLGTWTGHSGSVIRVAFSPDGRWLASGSQDGVVVRWPVLAMSQTVDARKNGTIRLLR